ncbi:MAG: hypothetical protein A3F16_03130 [Deltaproteobacteria bacterium RIFCSPHIGHO2_12_FULL_43_9]|nr:MAG: hypothetical protein A3F16_03130 [Deltaproteobacteria bacterium RIFCSPHIGHO2_12_FULL_43_9]
MRLITVMIILNIALLAMPATLFAGDEDIKIEVTSMVNFARSTGIEVCGTAVHKNGVAPLLVTIKHTESYYTTLTAPNGVWCQLIRRWTFSGEVDVTAAPLLEPNKIGAKLKFNNEVVK